jgi:hypothetical protein
LLAHGHAPRVTKIGAPQVSFSVLVNGTYENLKNYIGLWAKSYWEIPTIQAPTKSEFMQWITIHQNIAEDLIFNMNMQNVEMNRECVQLIATHD